MRRILFAILTISILAFPILLSPSTALAQDCAAKGGHCIDDGLHDCLITERILHGTECEVNTGFICCAPGGVGCELSPPLSGIGINTAIGCIPGEDLNSTAGFFLSWGVGIAGGVALIIIVYASFIMMTSSGDPKRLQAGKELLVASLSGLIMLIFGVYVLRIVGVEILQIPGLKL